MGNVLRGGCLCGAVRYEYAGELGESSYCHCDDCKKATGGPYTVGVLSDASLLTIVRGQVKGYTTQGRQRSGYYPPVLSGVRVAFVYPGQGLSGACLYQGGESG